MALEGAKRLGLSTLRGTAVAFAGGFAVAKSGPFLQIRAVMAIGPSTSKGMNL
jgi:hypothetical protein